MSLEGVLVVDKPEGPTSHDVVQRVRRRLGTRRVGHAGTLDPAASGVLVVLVGQGTKLGPYLTADDKRYVAVVRFGAATTTLDREGEVTERVEPPTWLREALAIVAGGGSSPRLEATLGLERERREQVPPAFSAIKVGGQRSYDRARRGTAEVLSPRSVRVFELRAVAADPTEPTLTVELLVSKGYYVRALARDLGANLGVPAHLAALQRIGSGPFTLERAVNLDDDALDRAVIPLVEVARSALRPVELTPLGADKARVGKILGREDFVADPPADARPFAWISPRSRLVAVGHAMAPGGPYAVDRGFDEGTPIAVGDAGPLSSGRDG